MNDCNFDRVAPFYPGIERFVFGRKLTAARNAALARIPLDADVLLLGEGNGRFLAELYRRNPHARVTCVEPSAAMRAAQAWRLRKCLGRVPETLTVVPCRIQEWKPADGMGFDAIVAHFFLDLFSEAELPDVLKTVQSAAKPAARLHVAEFEIPSAGWKRTLARGLVRVMYAFFFLSARLRTRRLPDWRAALARDGWREAAALSGPHFIQSSVWSRMGVP